MNDSQIMQFNRTQTKIKLKIILHLVADKSEKKKEKKKIVASHRAKINACANENTRFRHFASPVRIPLSMLYDNSSWFQSQFSKSQIMQLNRTPWNWKSRFLWLPRNYKKNKILHQLSLTQLLVSGKEKKIKIQIFLHFSLLFTGNQTNNVVNLLEKRRIKNSAANEAMEESFREMRGHALESSSLSSPFLNGVSALRGSFDAEADQSGFATKILALHFPESFHRRRSPLLSSVS